MRGLVVFVALLGGCIGTNTAMFEDGRTFLAARHHVLAMNETAYVATTARAGARLVDTLSK